MENNTIRTRIFGQQLAAEAIVNAIPTRYFKDPNTTFFDPAMGGGQYLAAVVKRCEKYHKREQILPRVYGVESNMMFIVRAKRYNQLRGANLSMSFDWPKMKFDVVIGNPPYQLPGHNQDKSGHKLYSEFAKLAFDKLAEGGFVSYLTPIGVFKKNKWFSLSKLKGIKSVDFTANDFFNVGATICQWTYEDGYEGDVTVITKDGTLTQAYDEQICDYSATDIHFAKLYHHLKDTITKPSQRMFKQNPCDTRARSFEPIEGYYPVYRLDKGVPKIFQYNKPVPKLLGKKKYVVGITKAFNKQGTIVSNLDFDVAHMFVEVESDEQVANLESFIFSPYFVEHVAKFKKMDGYGFNMAIRQLPPFDINRPWTNEEVKAFVESI